MTSDTDFHFIMGTILGWKQDSTLSKALEKASITNVGGITSLTNQAIDGLKYQDGSSRTPVSEECKVMGINNSYVVSAHLSSQKMMKASRFMEIGRTLLQEILSGKHS
jgi:hypothetical protein